MGNGGQNLDEIFNTCKRNVVVCRLIIFRKMGLKMKRFSISTTTHSHMHRTEEDNPPLLELEGKGSYRCTKRRRSNKGADFSPGAFCGCNIN